MKTAQHPMQPLTACILAIMLLFGPSVKGDAAIAPQPDSALPEYGITIDGKDITLAFPPAYQPASKAVADTVTALYQRFVPSLDVWTYTRPETESLLRAPNGDNRIQSYIAVAHIPEKGGKSYSRKEFREAIKAFTESRTEKKTTLEKLKNQLATMPPQVDALAELQTGQTYSLWLSAVDSEESQPQKRDIMLSGELFMRKNAKPLIVYFFRFHKSAQDLDELLNEMEHFRRNIEP